MQHFDQSQFDPLTFRVNVGTEGVCTQLKHGLDDTMFVQERI